MSRPRKNIMLAYPLEEKRLLKWPKPFIVQPKIDGDRCLAYFNDGKFIRLASSTDLTIVSVPHIELELKTREREISDRFGLNSFALDGELYVPNVPFEEHRSIVSRKKFCHPDYKKATFQVFDIRNFTFRQSDRLAFLHSALDNSEGQVRLVNSTSCYDYDELMEYLGEFMTQGYEGIIARNKEGSYYPMRSANLLKLKPTKTDHYQIVGTVEEVSIDGFPKNSLGAFICEKDGMRFQIGTGPALTRAARNNLWLIRDSLPGHILEIKYQELTDRGVLRSPVAMRIMPFEIRNTTNRKSTFLI